MSDGPTARFAFPGLSNLQRPKSHDGWLVRIPRDTDHQLPIFQALQERLAVATSDQRTDEIDRLLAHLDELTDDDVWFLADLWQHEDSAARQRAWMRAKAAIEAAGYAKALNDVRAAVGDWMKATRADFHGIEGLLGSASGVTGGRQAAAPAAIDAAAAILAGDALDKDDQAVLSRPWQTLVSEDSDQSSA